jgi:hypothetical protein
MADGQKVSNDYSIRDYEDDDRSSNSTDFKLMYQSLQPPRISNTDGRSTGIALSDYPSICFLNLR